MKLFTAVSYEFIFNRLVCSSLASLSLPSLMFASKARSPPQSEAPGKVSLANIILGCKAWPGTNVLAYCKNS
jgi:hypothetical protein